MNKIGHFGTPALVAGIVAVVLLIVALAVPFAVSDFSADGVKNEWHSHSDMSDRFDAADGFASASPGLMLGGIIMAMVAGILLVVVGFVPMPVLVARFSGWVLGLVGAIGGFMTFSASAYWLGLGFTNMLGAITPNPDAFERLWIVSPVLVFVGAGALMMSFFTVMTEVMAKRDGLREQARVQLKGAMIAAIFLAVVLIVPWSMQVLTGDETRMTGQCTAAESCPASYTFLSAFGHSSNNAVRDAYTGAEFGGILGIAETTQDFEPAMFQGLAFSIKVMTATAWIGFMLGAVATMGPLLSSAFKLPAAARWSTLVQGLGLPMALWSTIMWILASSYMWRPSWEDGAVFAGTSIKDAQLWVWPGAPIFAGALLVIWALMQFSAVRVLFESAGGIQAVASKNAHSFD